MIILSGRAYVWRNAVVTAGALVWVVLLATTACRARSPVPSSALPTVVSFNRDIRPVMSNTCFKCHGPDVKANKSGLRLDVPEAARSPRTDAHGRVTLPIVPGKPDASDVWRRISATDPATVMPPPEVLHQLSARDKALFRRWIEQGARYEPHWSYVPPGKVPVPSVRQPGGVKHPVDAFILAALNERNVTPSPEADRRTLIRRLTLDLVGLPPTPAETEAFAADRSPGAYERLVDRLLASRHFGERMAVPWLDVVRFADSVGFHGDQRQNIFPYRDYVVGAFNSNMPFDRFTREQLAGDLLPDAGPEQRVASGFNRLNMITREGGAQPKEYLAKYAADRVRTVSTAWLGSTVGCAECHDHKFDPFAARDFYSMAAYFADIKQWGVYNNYKYTPEPELEGFNNDYPFPPEIAVDNEYLKGRAARLRERLQIRVTEAARAALADPAAAPALTVWTASVARRVEAFPDGWAPARPLRAVAGDDASATVRPDGSVRFTYVDLPEEDSTKKKLTGADVVKPKKRNTHVLTLQAPQGPLAAIRLDALPDPAHDGRVSRKKEGFFELKLDLAVQRRAEMRPEPLPIADAYPDHDTETYENAYAVASVRERWRSARAHAREQQSVAYLLREPITLQQGDRLVARITSTDVGRVRLAVSPFGTRLPGDVLPADVLEAFRAASPTEHQRELIAAEYVKGIVRDEEGFAAALRDLREIAECRGGKAFTMVTAATEPHVTRVLPRGNWQDETGPVVTPSPPGFLLATNGVQTGGTSARATRLDLANWLTSRENPLTARTFVNRLWKQFFGTALSGVVDDLGMQGEYPSHPELLDWLAVEFMDRGWDVKAMVRLLVTSATYRQSSRDRPELRDADPDNRLLARQNPRRLDAEFIRDNALFSAGLLNLEVGGPSALPYQPEGYYAQLNFPQREYQAHSDERQYRRGLYMHWQRTFLHPMLASFDAPSREECAAARLLSSTPQQALTLLNDPTFVEAARALAERVIGPQADFTRRVDAAFRLVLARAPQDREVASLRTFFDAQVATYTKDPDSAVKLSSVGLRDVPADVDPVQLAAWTSVMRVLLNLNETIMRY